MLMSKFQKNISTESSTLLTYLAKHNKRYFEISEVKAALPESSDNALAKLLSDMVNRGLLMRLKQGVYCVISYEEDPEQNMPEWHILPQYLVSEGKYYIGYYSAMEIHNLITQPSLKNRWWFRNR